MEIRKFESANAFIAQDLDGAESSVGPVRLAPKVLQGGAKLLARSWTYAFASFERKVGGASAGINAQGDDAGTALDSFCEELRDDTSAGRVLLHPAKGVPDNALSALRALDPRSDLYWSHHHELRGAGAVICADAVGGLDGRSVAIEGFDAAGTEIARGVYDRGGRVVAISTVDGAVVKEAGIDSAVLAQAWRAHGSGLVGHLDAGSVDAQDVFAADAEVLFVGSRAGVVDHGVAAGLDVEVLVPSGPVPVTARALAMLGRAGAVVLPDFVTTAGPIFAMWPDEGADLESVRGAAAVALRSTLADVLDHDEGPLLASCYRAESFLRTWRDQLPFGRPLA